jgi:hypothetical protein
MSYSAKLQRNHEEAALCKGELLRSRVASTLEGEDLG